MSSNFDRKWSGRSKQQLDTIDPRLEWVLSQILPLRDISVIKGHRPEAEQNEAFAKGFSKLKWPNGKHNTLPSKAVDVQPFPYNEETLREDLSFIAGMAVAFGATKGYTIRWGGDWDKDGETSDNGFDDLFHLEIVT